MWVVPSRYELFSCSTTWPLLLRLRRSLTIAGRVIYRHSRSSYLLIADFIKSRDAVKFLNAEEPEYRALLTELGLAR